LPTARGCNAECLGCISLQPEGSGFPSTQNRIGFRPSEEEILEIMHRHAANEAEPIFSFGQGCEGEPLLEADLIGRTVARYRQDGGRGTVNINTNGSLPSTMAPLAEAGLSSIRVSLNSARPEIYEAYYRPRSYGFGQVRECLQQATQAGLFVSLNLLFFPGISDTEPEYEALAELIRQTGVDFVQLRNLNLDPELYLNCLPEVSAPSMGLPSFRKRLAKDCPGLGFGYFNPYLPSGR
jgi:molybdenum cofactor biosynthesis enzyme MoaA